MKYPHPVYLAAARRSAIGRFGGGLKSLAPAKLALPVAQGIAPESLRPAIDQVILGQVLQAGSGMNVARQLGLALGVPLSAPAFTVNMVCASGLKAIMLAADAVNAGEASLVLAGGVENMSRAPHYAFDQRWGRKLGAAELADAIFTDGLTDPLLQVSMGKLPSVSRSSSASAGRRRTSGSAGTGPRVPRASSTGAPARTGRPAGSRIPSRPRSWPPAPRGGTAPTASGRCSGCRPRPCTGSSRGGASAVSGMPTG